MSVRPIAKICATGLLGMLAFMAQIGPDDLASNLSKWVSKVTPPPEWIKAPGLDTIWTIGFAVMAALVLLSYFWPGLLAGKSPSPKPEKQKANAATDIVKTVLDKRAAELGLRSGELSARAQENGNALFGKKPKYALPPDAEKIQVKSLSNKDLGKLISAVAEDISKMLTHYKYQDVDEISLFNKHFAAKFFWLYGEARDRGHRDEQLDLYFSHPDTLKNVSHLASQLERLGSRLPLYYDH